MIAEQVHKQQKQSLWQNFRTSMGARPFQILMGMTVLIVLGVYSFTSLAFYMNTYHVYGGDTKAATTIAGMAGTLKFGLGFLIIPLITKLARRWGKERMMQICLVGGMLTGVTKWFCYTPAHPYWQLLDAGLDMLPGAGFWVLINAMKADICDWDEWRSGMRREGAFASISVWLQKFSSAIGFSITGCFLVLIGFEQARGGGQAPETMQAMRLGFCLAPILVYGLAVLIMQFYPLSKERMNTMRAELEARRGRV